ncbi:uncharacterized protein LOC125025306 [Penaeus chinensis]|uniref:uncharacterized protein LOC125025306 n=1 Tax=Penaeus chinensis TaxID=139456 RepID=UPI001FB6BF9F|nr:uncharacterized protein LOC125025306 [Penaeus chinensis]
MEPDLMMVLRSVQVTTDAGKLENVKRKATRLGIREARWKKAGKFQTDSFTFIYSVGEKHENDTAILLDKETSKSLLGVLLVKLKGKNTNLSIVQGYAPTSQSTEEETGQFYEEIDRAKDQCGSQDMVIVMGDFNAKVSKQRGFAVGEYGLALRNERGNKLVDWCIANEQVITNTWFYHHPRRRWTWKSPGDNTRNQIDYRTISKRYRNAVRAIQALIVRKGKVVIKYVLRDIDIEPKVIYKNIKNLTVGKAQPSAGCIKSKERCILMEKEAILTRWSEYIKDLFNDNRGQKPEIHKNMEGLKILQSKIRSAVKKMKKNKAPGPDEIVIEMIDALEDFGIQRLTTITNIIYDTGEIPDILLKSIFIALPKKTGATECELHRTISLMSHIMKIILKVLMQRARRCIKPEISTGQFGFEEDSGTRNAVFILRMLSERAIEMHRKLFVCTKTLWTCFNDWIWMEKI